MRPAGALGSSPDLEVKSVAHLYGFVASYLLQAWNAHSSLLCSVLIPLKTAFGTCTFTYSLVTVSRAACPTQNAPLLSYLMHLVGWRNEKYLPIQLKLIPQTHFPLPYLQHTYSQTHLNNHPKFSQVKDFVRKCVPTLRRFWLTCKLQYTLHIIQV